MEKEEKKKLKQLNEFRELTRYNTRLMDYDVDFLQDYQILLSNIKIDKTRHDSKDCNSLYVTMKMKSMIFHMRNKSTSEELKERVKRFIIICMLIKHNDLQEDSLHSNDFYDLMKLLTENIKEDSYGENLSRREIVRDFEIKITDILRKMENQK